MYKPKPPRYKVYQTFKSSRIVRGRMEIQLAQKRKFVEGDHVRVKDHKSTGLWEVYAIHKTGRKVRYSVRRLQPEATTLFCNIKGSQLEKVEEK